MTYAERIAQRSSRETEQMVDDAIIATSQTLSLVAFNTIVGIILGAFTIVYNMTGRNFIGEMREQKKPMNTQRKTTKK